MLGKLVKGTNNVRAYFSGLDTDVAAIESVFGSNNQYALLQDVPRTYDGFKGNILQWISQLGSKAEALLTDRDLVLEHLPVGSSSDRATVLKRMANDMVDNTQTIESNTVTLSAITATTTNANAGTAIIDKVLDGATNPGNGIGVFDGYVGLDSELCEDDTVTLECQEDSETGGTLGSERFSWLGKVPSPSAFHWQDTGSGTGPTIQVLNAQNYLTNLDFESFASNAPSGWTIDAGTAGVHIFQESTTYYRLTSALKFTGNASIASIQISQSPSSSLVPLKRYCFACYIQGQAGTSAGTLTIQFEGTGYTPGATEKITMNAAALAAQTTYGLEYFHVNMPREVPDDLKLVIKWTGTPSAHSVRIDAAAFGPVQYVNGMNVVIVAGQDKFLKGDKLAFTVSQNDNGVFQTWFRRWFGFQLPSDPAPSISDTLAT